MEPYPNPPREFGGYSSFFQGGFGKLITSVNKKLKKIIHISDLHFRSIPKDNFIQIHRLNCIQERFPDHRIILTGDIVDDGHADQYEQALEALLPFKNRLFVCPGNHDYGEVGTLFSWQAKRRFQKFARFFGMHYLFKDESVLYLIPGNPDICFIGLDSNLHTKNPLDLARGEIGGSQLKKLSHFLKFLDTKLRPIIVLCLHHHPFHRGYGGELRDEKQFMRTISGKIDVLCFGHKHKQNYWQYKQNIPHICAAGALRDSRKIWEIIIDREIIVNEVIL